MLSRLTSFLDDTTILPNQNIKDESDYLILGYRVSKTSVDHVRGKIKLEP